MGGVRGELNTADIGSISDCAGAVQLPLCQKQVLIRIFSFSISFKEMFHIKRVSRNLISQLKHQKKKMYHYCGRHSLIVNIKVHISCNIFFLLKGQKRLFFLPCDHVTMGHPECLCSPLDPTGWKNIFVNSASTQNKFHWTLLVVRSINLTDIQHSC